MIIVWPKGEEESVKRKIQPQFGGAFKQGESILGPLEKKLVVRWVNRIPSWLETYHLTLLAIPWTGLVIASARQVRSTGEAGWLWGFSIAVILQYLTDLLMERSDERATPAWSKWDSTWIISLINSSSAASSLPMP